MNFYDLEDSLQPRVFILSCNENALVIQSTVNESKIVINNSVLTDYYSIIASSNLLLQYGSNILTQFSYNNNRANQWSDLHYLNQLEIQPTSNHIQFNSNAQIYYTDNILNLKFPSPTHTFQVNGNIVSSGTIYASNLQITGDTTILNTVTSNTEEMIITNLGSGPALKVTQIGPTPVAEFYDDETLAFLVADGGTIGIHTSYPLQMLDVRGSQYISGNLGIGITDPLYRLHVVGDSLIDGNLNLGAYTLIASNLSGTATQVQNDLIIGSYLTGVNYNGSIATTWAVDADSANTPNKVVVRDGDGNFKASLITATLNGTATQVSSTLTRGSYLTGNNFTGASPTTWAVDADSVNTANKVVVRDASGNFSAGTITATLSGTATQVSSTLTRGSYLTGTNYNGSIATTWAVDADSANTANKVVVRDGDGNFKASLITATLNGTATQVSSTLTRGSYLTGNDFTGASATTWAVDADSTNTANKVVVRDASGNFSAGTITATLSGTATQVSSTLTRGSYLTGVNYNGSIATTWAVDADSANIANKVVVRDASGNFSAGTITATLSGTATQVTSTLIRGSYLTGVNYNGSIATTWAVDADSINIPNKVVVRDDDGNFKASLITANLNGTATQVSSTLTRGSYLTGNDFTGAFATTWAVDADTAATANKIVARDALGYLYATGVGIGTTTARQLLDIQGGHAIVSGNIGIGTTVPLQGLDVRGTIIATTLGIGTTAPRAEVDIIGTTLHTGNIGIGTTIAKYPIHVHSSDSVFTVNNGKVGISYGIAISPSTDLEIRNSSDTSYSGILLTNDGNNYPTASLRIESKRYDQSPNIAYAGNMGLYRYNNNASLNSGLPLGLIHFGGNHTSGSISNKAFSAYLGAISEEAFSSSSNMRTSLIFASGSNAYDYYDPFVAHTNEKMRLNSYGNLGIGTTSPITTLDVRGNVLMGKGTNGVLDSFIGGPYHKQSGWDAADSSHTIVYPDYCIADNSSGTLHIQVKSATANKLGNASVSFLKANATAVDLFNIHYHKTANLTTFSISASTNDIMITTDSDCAIAWTSIGSC